jgi:DNA-binding IclR family transcriptional regulator
MKPKVASLGEGTGAIGVGAIEQNGQGIFVFFTGEYFNKNPIGEHFDLHKNAVGKAMLAEMEDDRVEQILDRNGFEQETKHTISDRETLFEHLSEIRERKFAIAQGERTEHLHAVGAAVYEPESDTLGGLSITLPKNRVTLDELENELASEVLGTIDEIQMEIKYG